MTDTAIISNEISSFAKQITMTWRKVAAAIVETGQKLLEARQKLSASQFNELKDYLKENEGISAATMSKLQAIARHPILGERDNFNSLPPSYTVLYRLTQANEGAVREALENGELSSSLQMPDVEKMFFSSANASTSKHRVQQPSVSETVTVITINGKLTTLNKTTQKILHKALELVKLEQSINIEEC